MAKLDEIPAGLPGGSISLFPLLFRVRFIGLGMIAVGTLLGSLGGCGSEQAEPARVTPSPSESEVGSAPTARHPRVVFLGDSITAGYDLPEAASFPALLAADFADRGKPFQLINAGVSGDTTHGALRRLDWILQESAEIVVIQLGANDAFRGAELASVEENLERMIARITARGAKPVLLGMRIPPNYGTQYADDFAHLYDRVASKTGVRYQPFFMSDIAGHPDLNLADGIHPNREGHRLLAARVAPLLEPLIPSSDPGPRGAPVDR